MSLSQWIGNLTGSVQCEHTLEWFTITFCSSQHGFCVWRPFSSPCAFVGGILFHLKYFLLLSFFLFFTSLFAFFFLLIDVFLILLNQSSVCLKKVCYFFKFLTTFPNIIFEFLSRHISIWINLSDLKVTTMCFLLPKPLFAKCNDTHKQIKKKKKMTN